MAKGKSPMARTGKSNGRWQGGRSKSYRRKVAGAKTGDGKVVHHKDGNKSNNKKSNFKLMTRAKHNKVHPDRSKGSGRVAKVSRGK